jgi:hypothetical protein
MNDLEARFISLSQELHTIAKRAAEARKVLIIFYLTEHYPGLPYTITIMDDNILAVDLVFPTVSHDISQYIVDEVADYLQGLLLPVGS